MYIELRIWDDVPSPPRRAFYPEYQPKKWNAVPDMLSIERCNAEPDFSGKTTPDARCYRQPVYEI
jgi:hypothetical protein